MASLASSSDWELVRTVVSNPNTPVEVLLQKSRWHPGAFLQNPVLPLLLLESPGLLLELPDDHLEILVSHKDFPRWILHEMRKLAKGPRLVILLRAGAPVEPEEMPSLCAEGSPSLRKVIAGLPNAPRELLKTLLCDADTDVRMAAARNAKAPRAITALLHRAGANKDLSGFTRLKRLVSQEELQELKQLGPFGRALWMYHPLTRFDEIPYSFQDFLCCLMALVHRDDTPSWMLKDMLQNGSKELKALARHHPNFPPRPWNKRKQKSPTALQTQHRAKVRPTPKQGAILF